MRRKGLLNPKVLLAFGSAVLTLLAMGVVSYRRTIMSHQSDQKLRHSHEVLENLQDLLFAAERIESSYRGFALNGNESYLESYRSNLVSAQQHEAALRALTVDNPSQQRRISDIEKLVEQKTEFAEMVISMRRVKGMEGAAEFSQSALGQRIMENLLSVAREFQNEELQLLKLRDADAETRSAKTRFILILGTLLGLSITAAAGWGALRDNSRSGVATRALGESEEKYRGLLEAAPDAMVVVNEAEEIVLLNLQAEKQFGYLRHELVGKSVKSIIPEGFAERLVADGLRSEEAALAQQIGTGIELTGRRKNGSGFPIEIMLSPLASAEGTLVTAAIRNISVRKEAESHLEHMEARYRGLLEAAPDAIVVVNESGEIVLLNLQAEKQFGYQRHELVGKGVKSIIPQGFAERLVADGLRTEEAALTQQIGTGIELTGRRKDGSGFPIEIMLSPLASAEGILVTAAIRNILVRKEAEGHLAQMEARYRGLLEAAPDAMVVVNPAGEIVLLNLQAEKQFGYQRHELVGKSVKSIIPQGFAERLVADGLRSEADALAQQIGTGIELTGRRKNGSDFPIEIMLSPLESAEGILVTAAIRNISARKEAEATLAKLAAIVDSSDDAIISKNLDGIIQSWNSGAERLYGYSKQEAVGQSVAILAPPGGKDDICDVLTRIAKSELVEHCETQRVRKDGQQIYVSMTISVLKDSSGKAVGASTIARNITERKRAEAERLRLTTAIEQAAEGVLVTDKDGEIQYVNPAFSAMTGYSREEVLGKNPRILKSGKHDAAFYLNLWATLTAGQVWRGEMINRRKDGSLYTEKMSITAVHNENDEITQIVAMKEDITARKLLEDQFRQAQKMEAVGRLAAGVAHDFNNLLTIIIGYCDVMLDRLAAGDPMRAYTVEIKSAGERAGGLTRQLLAFSRQQVLAPQVLDLNALIANVTKLLKRLMGEDIDLVFKASPCSATIRADPGLIEQALMNLAVNARDAMPLGGSLTIETLSVQLDEAYTTTHFCIPVGAYFMLAVSDTGCGMDKDIQAHVFEPFFTTKEIGKGTGLGLATVYGIVKQSGGNILLYSEVGVGTTFKIYFPAVAAVPAVATEDAMAVGGSETVLLAEDDPNLRELARMVLADKGGYKVLASSGGKEARLFAEQFKGKIHLLLTDVVMPGMNGRELGEELAPLRPEMKILYMSGYTSDTVVRHGVLEKRMAFLQKPFSAESLLHKVRDILDSRPLA